MLKHLRLSKGQIMLNNYTLPGIGMTLVGALFVLTCSASAQSQSLNRSIPQIASDAVGFDSGLWRSEFLQQPKQGKDETAAAVSAEMQNATASDAAKSSPPAFAYSDKLVTIPLDTPPLIDPQMLDANGQATLQEETTMSEWENAVAVAGASVTPGFTASGPSITSAIVGFVGIMIVIGAYVSSGKRNR